jgi:DNA-binding transcriptional LysR family regulator
MELRHLRYFVAVAEELHFGHAAARVHIAQPALSIQIKGLEQMLGGKLFDRTGKRVALTEAGKLFLHEARQTLLQAERAAAVAHSALRGELGRLELAYSGSAAYSGILRKYIQGFRRSHPSVELHLAELDPVSQLAQLCSGQTHIGFMTTLALQVPGNITTIPLASWPLMVALSADHPLARQESIPTDALRNEAFVIYSGEKSILNSLLDFSPATTHLATNLMMVLTLAGAGLGIALLPACLQNEAPNSGVVFRPFADRHILMDCSLVYPCIQHEPVARAFITSVRTMLSANPTLHDISVPTQD